MDKPNILFLMGIPDQRVATIDFDESGNPDLKLDGNCGIEYLKRDGRLSGTELTLGGPDNRISLELDRKPDIVFNRICSPEGNVRALKMAIKLSEAFGRDNIPILNHPRNVLLSSRDRAPDLYRDIEGLVVPPVKLLESPRLKTVIEHLEAGAISFPFIIRTTVDHNGMNMVLVSGESDLEELDVLPFDGRDYVVVSYIDYRDDEGYFSKYRLFKIGNNIVPRQMILSNQWKIHGEEMDNVINQRPELKEKRDAFRSDPESILGAERMAVLHEVFQRLGLDYVGADFAPLPDNRVLLFEANACMKIVMKNRSERAARRNAGIKDGFVQYILERIGQ